MHPCKSSVSSVMDLEDSFDDDFEQDLTDEDRTYVYAVITRLRRVLHWDPSDDELMVSKERGPLIIRDALTQFLRWKYYANECGGPESYRIQHLIIYSLAKLSFYYWIKDSSMVAEILTEVHKCDGHFSCMFAHIINRYGTHSLWRQISDCSKKTEESVTVFFVHHAYKSRLKFEGVRFVDLRLRHPQTVPPVFLTAICNKPYLLLHLLRYGAKVDVLRCRINDDWNLSMLLRHLIRILWNSVGEDLNHLDFYSPYNSTVISNTIHHVAECLRVLLRVIPQIHMGEITFLLMKFEQGILSGSVCSHDFIRLLSERGLVPNLVNRYLEPSDLRHLCRCAIREALNRSWNLPYGISLLPVPNLVKCYLSLAAD